MRRRAQPRDQRATRSRRLGGGSVDASTGSIKDLFDFGPGNRAKTLLLDPSTGTVTSNPPEHGHGH